MIACPLCPGIRTASKAYATRNGTSTTETTLRTAIRQHLLDAHPQMGPRERSMAVDRATCAHHVVTPVLEAWTAEGPRPFRCLTCGSLLGESS